MGPQHQSALIARGLCCIPTSLLGRAMMAYVYRRANYYSTFYDTSERRHYFYISCLSYNLTKFHYPAQATAIRLLGLFPFPVPLAALSLGRQVSSCFVPGDSHVALLGALARPRLPVSSAPVFIAYPLM